MDWYRGRSPFGNKGYNPEELKLVFSKGEKTALKVWDQRVYKNLDNNVELHKEYQSHSTSIKKTSERVADNELG